MKSPINTETTKPEESTSKSLACGRDDASLRTLLWILVLGALVRLAVWGYFAGSEVQIVDAQDYDRLAVGLVETGEYRTSSGQLSSLRPPLYPWCVAKIYQAFGLQSYEAVRLIQSLLSLATVVIVYRLGSLTFSSRTGLLAALLYCFYPTALGFNNLILSETLFTFLVALSVLLLAESATRSSALLLACAGIVLGLGALTRSILWLYMPFLGLLIVLFWPGTWTRRIAGIALLMVSFAVTIAPWAYRNTQVQETTTIIDVMGGRNVMMGNYEHTPLERSWATIEIVQGEQSWIRVLIKEQGTLKGLTQGQIDKLAMRHGIHFMLANPGLTLKRSVVRFFNFWQLDRTLVAGLRAGFWRETPTALLVLIAVVVMGSYAMLAYTGIFGVVFAEPRDPRLHYLLLFNIAFPCLVHSAIFAHSRYHLPTMPLVCIYSAVAILSCRRILTARPSYWKWLAVCLCLVLSMGWIREIVMVDSKWLR